MAQKSPVLLGFEDELITEKYKNEVKFTTNKIGGNPVSYPSNLKITGIKESYCRIGLAMYKQRAPNARYVIYLGL